MKSDSRTAGLALILGQLTGIVTMALHPTGADLLTAGDRGERMSDLAVIVHAIALAGIPILVFGFFGLTRRLESAGSIPLLAFIVYAVGCLAIVCAAVADGLMAPAVLHWIRRADPAERESLYLLLRYTGLLNQAFAKVFVVASSVAVILWSFAIARSGLLARIVAIAGYVIGAASLAAFFSGHLRLDAHGFGTFVFVQAAWTIAVGLQMRRHAADGILWSEDRSESTKTSR